METNLSRNYALGQQLINGVPLDRIIDLRAPMMCANMSADIRVEMSGKGGSPKRWLTHRLRCSYCSMGFFVVNSIFFSA